MPALAPTALAPTGRAGGRPGYRGDAWPRLGACRPAVAYLGRLVLLARLASDPMNRSGVPPVADRPRRPEVGRRGLARAWGVRLRR